MTNLERRIIRYRLIDQHRVLVRAGAYETASVKSSRYSCTKHSCFLFFNSAITGAPPFPIEKPRQLRPAGLCSNIRSYHNTTGKVKNLPVFFSIFGYAVKCQGKMPQRTVPAAVNA